MKRAAWGRRFHHLLRGKREKERHAHVIYRKMNGVSDASVTLMIHVGPDQPNDGAASNEARVVDKSSRDGTGSEPSRAYRSLRPSHERVVFRLR